VSDETGIGAAPAGPVGEPTVRIRLDIAYDGTGFSGWARQPGLRTVQGELETALATIFTRHGDVPGLVVAGRTDAGVHALGQVAHLDLTGEQLASLGRPHRGPARMPGRRPGGRRAGGTSAVPAAAPLDGLETLARRVNGIAGLSSDVHVGRASFAPAGFDARFSAVWRRYRYRVSDQASPRNPLERGHTLWYPRIVDEHAMNAAAESLLGLHDFAAYCKPREVGTTIRTLQDFRWRRLDDGLLVADVRADAFCHSMVRALVGATLAVGEGRLRMPDLRALRDAGERTDRFKIVPAKGLTLVEVGYPPDAELEARAVRTRAIRPPLEVRPSSGSWPAGRLGGPEEQSDSADY
jgi:tRNA pseudouridine38-40 synthase